MPKTKSSEPTALPAAAQSGVSAVNRALQILDALADGSDGTSLAALSKRTGLYKSTILRLAESLIAFGLVERSAEGVFRLGSDLIRLGELAKRTRRSSDDILAILRNLTEQTGESSTYYIRRQEHRLALFRVDSPKTVRDHIRAGDLLPLDRGAAGHIFREFSKGKAEPNVFAIKVSHGERDPEVAAVAGPVFSGGALAGVLSISGPRHRFNAAAIRKFSTLLTEQCEWLSRALDMRRP